MKKILVLFSLALTTQPLNCMEKPDISDEWKVVIMCKCRPGCHCNHQKKPNHNEKQQAQQNKPPKQGFWHDFVQKMNIKLNH